MVNNHIPNIDVLLVTSYHLTKSPPCWVSALRFHTMVGDEGHIYLRGQHSKACQDVQSNTLTNWTQLQQHTKSVFVLTGTPLCTNVTYDYVAILKAIAPEEVRINWDPALADQRLKDFFAEWVPMKPNVEMTTSALAAQAARAKRAAELWALFTIRRDGRSEIHGQRVLRDFLGECQMFDQPLKPPTDQEYHERELLYARCFGGGQTRFTKEYNLHIRCLSYSSRYPQWRRCRSNAWADFSNADIQKHIRTARLRELLLKGKCSGNGVVVFVDRVFLLELAVNVLS